MLQINHDRYDNGDIGKLDYEQLDLQLAQYESDESSAEMNLVQASDQLQLLIGYQKPSRTFDITGDIVPPAVPGTLTDLSKKRLQRGRITAQPRQRCAWPMRVCETDLRQWNCGSYVRGRLQPLRHLQLRWLQRFHPRSEFLIVTRATKTRASFRRSQAGSAKSPLRIRSIPTSTRPGLAIPRPKCFLTATTATIFDEAKDVLSIAQFAYERGGLALLDYLSALQDDRTTS